MGGRRGRNEGSIRQRAGGLWEAVLSLGIGADGKRIRKSVYGKTKTEVQDKYRELSAQYASGIPEPSKQTVAQFVDRFLEIIKSEVRTSTWIQYEYVLRRYVKARDGFGNMPLQRLTPLHVQSLLTAMDKDGTSPRVRQLTHAVLRRMFKSAVVLGQMARNPTEGVKAPRVAKTVRDLWTPEQTKAFLDAAHDDSTRLWALYVVAIATGMRQGELLGLQWPDVDLKTVPGSVAVRRSLVETGGIIRGLHEPKTKSAVRTITLPEHAVAALRAHKARLFEEGLAACPLVFPNRKGAFMAKRPLGRAFERRIAAVPGLPKIRFHDLRHLSATLSINLAGADVKTVQARLGHADATTTLNTYAHVFKGRDKAVAQAMDSVFTGVGGESK
jgi:integrase